jgi:patatin-like phospholipase/acyl hydrolase
LTTTASDKQTIALFNYGGGIRGLIPAYIMAKIEDATDLRMTEMVDIFSGPSTGSILNAAMTLRHPDEPSQPKYRARHMVRFYEREGINIFPPDSFREFRGLIHDVNNRTVKLNKINNIFKHGHYDPTYLGAALRALFGDIKLKDSLRSLIIPSL